MTPNLLHSKHWLAILCHTIRDREDSGGVHYTDDLGWVWWVQDGMNRQWLGLSPDARPVFPEPIMVKRI